MSKDTLSPRAGRHTPPVWHFRRSWPGLLALIAGALLPLSLAPYSFWISACIAPAILAWLLRRSSNMRSVFGYSFAFGLGLFAFGSSWVYVSIHDFGATGVPLALVMTALFVSFLAAVFTLPFCLFYKALRAPILAYAFIFPALWVCGEWSRSWLLTGFPWLYVGYAHLDTVLAGWAPLAGVFSVSFASVLSGTAVLAFIAAGAHAKGKAVNFQTWLRCALLVFTVACVWVFPYSLKNTQWTTARDGAQSVALLQPNIELYRKWNPIYFSEIFSVLYTLSSQHWDKDIQIWPEAAIPSLLNNVRSFTDDIDEKAENTQTHIFSGVLYDNEDPYEVYNSIVGLGLAEGTYFKQKLVPFGEYVPFEDQLRGLIQFFDLPNSVIRRGPFRKDALSAKTRQGYDYIVAPFICYEVVYPDFVAKNSRDASLLLTISNDAWFGDSIGPLQHFEMVRMRALENQKYMLRATNTGVSGIINEEGQVLAVSEQFIETTLSGFVELREGVTPYAKTGSTPLLALCFLIIGVFYLRERLSQPVQG